MKTELRSLAAAALGETRLAATDDPKKVNRHEAKQSVSEIEFVNRSAYVQGATEGSKALRGSVDDANIDSIADELVARVMPFSAAATVRIADEFASFTDTLLQHPDLAAETAAFWKQVNEKLDALGSDVTAYADPPWNAGYIAYGQALSGESIAMVWVCEDDATSCDDCVEWGNGGPYTLEDVPSYPGSGDSQCLNNCRCTLQADPETWAAAFGGDS